MKLLKCFEHHCKKGIRNILKHFLTPVPVMPEEFDSDSIFKILVVRQDCRLGNLVLMTPLISGLKEAFPGAELDVLVSENFEEVYAYNPHVDRIIVFRKKKARFMPWWYIKFIGSLRENEYDLAVDVSNGYHFSLNNIVLTSLSGARYCLGYDRDDARSFLNLLAPLPSRDTHIADALFGLVTYLSPDVKEFQMSYYVPEDDKTFAEKWLKEHDIMGFDSFFVIHPGGRGNKQWGAENFAGLIDRISSEIGARIVVIGSAAEEKTILLIRNLSKTYFDILDDVTIQQMAAVIERSDLFISNDTGPMHVAEALGRPTIGIFISSNFKVYGPRGRNSRIVIGGKGPASIDDVLLAVTDLMCGTSQVSKTH